MAKLITVWLFGAAVFTFGNVYAASPNRPTDEDAIGAQAQITLIQAILDDEDEDLQGGEDLQDDEDLQEDQDDLEGEGDAQDDDEDQEDSSREWTTPS